MTLLDLVSKIIKKETERTQRVVDYREGIIFLEKCGVDINSLGLPRHDPLEFHDWFENDFEFSGFVLNINSVMNNNEPYLLFNLENKDGVEFGQKRFLFSGNSLILKN